jgi:nitrogenase-associated protein
VAVVTFYEKPGCGTNARQKQALKAAGHELVVRDLLSTPWTPQALLAFLEPLPVAAWFNPVAPRLKSGEIDPQALDPQAALMLLAAEPILIRRPLIEVAGKRYVGFDEAVARALLQAEPVDAEGLEGCSRAEHAAPCPAPARK